MWACSAGAARAASPEEEERDVRAVRKRAHFKVPIPGPHLLVIFPAARPHPPSRCCIHAPSPIYGTPRPPERLGAR